MKRQLSKDLPRAAAILQAEIEIVLLAKLRKAGFETDFFSEKPHKAILAGGQAIATVSTQCVRPPGKVPYILLTVSSASSSGAAFSKMFKLHETESPKKTACLLVKFLRRLLVSDVMRV